MEREETFTSCPEWFPFFLLGIGGICSAASQIFS